MVATFALPVIIARVQTPSKLLLPLELMCLILVTQALLELVQEVLQSQLIALPALLATIASTMVRPITLFVMRVGSAMLTKSQPHLKLNSVLRVISALKV